jgi:hypothetical protein
MSDHKRPLPPVEEVSGFYIHNKSKTLFVITKDIVLNQLRRETPKIAESFDKLSENELKQVSELIADTYSLLFPKIIGTNPNDQSRNATCARLLNTAATTFLGCLHLARGGFSLQYMMLARGVIENIATTIHLMMSPSALAQYHKGDLKSTKSVTAAGKILPIFGQMWGSLSNQFVHIGEMHSNINPLAAYKEMDESLHTIKYSAKIISWLLYIAAELVVIESLEETRYWKIKNTTKEGNEIQFDPSESERKWQSEFFES